MKRWVLILMLVVLGTGCASRPSDILPSYVSPLQYEKYDCEQISTEMERVNRRIAIVHDGQKHDRKVDKIKTGVGIVSFWPTLFFIGGDKAMATEYAELQGEKEALEQIAIDKIVITF